MTFKCSEDWMLVGALASFIVSFWLGTFTLIELCNEEKDKKAFLRCYMLGGGTLISFIAFCMFLILAH